MRKRTHRFFFFRVLDPPPFKIGGCDVKEKKNRAWTPTHSRSKRENAISMKENFVILFFNLFSEVAKWRTDGCSSTYACGKKKEKNIRHDFNLFFKFVFNKDKTASRDFRA